MISDSGTISEESTILGFLAITIRDSIERPEALDFGGIVMTGLNAQNVISGISEALMGSGERISSEDVYLTQALPEGYEVSNCSERVVRFMLSTVSRHHEWAGIRKTF